VPKVQRGRRAARGADTVGAVAYKPRIEVPHAHYHVVTRGNNRRRIFDDDFDRAVFLMILTSVARKYGWTIFAYVLMKNHYHFVIQLGACENGLSRGMCELNTGYAVEYNRRHDRMNHLFGKRYWSRHLKSDAELMSAIRYVLLNPVRAGMVDSPEAYFWSSYRATIGLALAIPRFAGDEVLALFGTKREPAIESLVEFCDPALSGPVRRQPP